MRVLSIIGVILFGILGLLCLAMYADIEPLINDLNSIGTFASLLDAGDDLSDFTSAVEALVGLAFISDIAGFILSIVGCFAGGKKIVYVEHVKEAA